MTRQSLHRFTLVFKSYLLCTYVLQHILHEDQCKGIFLVVMTIDDDESNVLQLDISWREPGRCQQCGIVVVDRIRLPRQLDLSVYPFHPVAIPTQRPHSHTVKQICICYVAITDMCLASTDAQQHVSQLLCM